MTKLIDADKLREQIKHWMPERNGEEHITGERTAFNSVLHYIDEAPDLSAVPVTDTPQFEEGFKTGQELAIRDITGWTFIDEKMRNALWNDLQMRYPNDGDKTPVGVDAGEFRDWLNSLPKGKDLSVKEDVDLEKEIDTYLEPIKVWQIQEAPYTSMENIARHFAKWGAEHLKNKQK